MKKNIFALFIIATLVLSLTGCGNNNQKTAAANEQTTIEYKGEGATQGGIKSDEEIAAITEEASQTENPNNVDMDGHEPSSSGNFQDYWEGDSYFDLVAYAKANNCRIFGMDGYADFTDDESKTMRYMIIVADKWDLYPTAGGCEFHTIDLEYSYITHDSGLEIPYASINRGPATLSIETIQAIDTIIHCIQADPNNIDPLSGSSVPYSTY